MPEVGIVMTLNDKVSSALKTISGNAKAFDKTIDELEAGFRGLTEAQNGLVAKQTELKKALAESNVKVEAAKNSYKRLKDEVSKGAMDAAIEEQTRLQRELKNTEQELKFNSKAYDGLYQSAMNAAKGMQKTKLESKDFATGIRDSGLLREFGSALSGAAGAYLTSAIGEPTAQLISQAIGGAMSGAAAGAFLGPLGMAGGAALGAIAGGISGWTAIEQAKDDAFKSYVQEAVEGQLSEFDSIRASGSAIAGQREQDQIAFAQRFGSDEAAREYLDRVKAMAVNTNYSYDEITGYSKSLLNTYDAEQTLGVLQDLSDATAGLNLDSSGVSMFINGLARMRTTNKATQEYLNYFSTRGLDVYDALSRATGADESKIADMVSKGQISGTEAAQAILDYIQEEFGGLSEMLAGTYDAMVDNLGDAEANLNAMMGKGYNETRKAGIQAQSDWLESGQLEEAYKAIGAWKAELENAKERYIREAVDAAIDSDDYKAAQAEGDAAEMGRIIMQAKIRGMNEYNANEGKDDVLAQELALIEGVRDDTALNQSYWDAGYTLGQEFSKGRAKGMMDDWFDFLFGSVTSGPGSGSAALGGESRQRADGSALGSSGSDYSSIYGSSSHASGLDRVPYDNYPALLHEGERVLTAREARAQDAGGTTVNITVTGNTFGAGMDAEAVAQALADQVALQMAAGGGR